MLAYRVAGDERIPGKWKSQMAESKLAGGDSQCRGRNPSNPDRAEREISTDDEQTRQVHCLQQKPEKTNPNEPNFMPLSR